MIGLAILLTEGLVVCVLAGIGYTIYTLTHPPRRSYAHAVARGRAGHPDELPAHPDGRRRTFEEWAFTSRGRSLPVWDLAGDLPTGTGPTFVLTHGWGDSRVGAMGRAAPLLPKASRIIVWDMPGHGEAPGRCSMGTGEVNDLLALIERVTAPEAGLYLFGWSLGAGVSIAAAAKLGTAIAGVIAEAPYRVPQTPARNVLRIRSLPHVWNVPPAFWMIGVDVGAGPAWRGFDRALHARELKCPLLVIHGELDAVCPSDDGRTIARAAPCGSIVEIRGGGHHGLWTDPATAMECQRALTAFIDECRSGNA